MNKISLLLGLSTFAVVSSSIAAQAQPSESTSEFVSVETPLLESNPQISNLNLTQEPKVTTANEQPLELKIITLEQTSTGEPAPGTTETSVGALFQSSDTNPVAQNASNQNNSTIAQSDIELGRLTSNNYSYISIGPNIGLTGGDNQTELAQTNFTISGKISLKSNVSVRPAIIIGDNAAFLIPVTYDFLVPGQSPFEPLPIVPYVGAGAIFSTTERSNVGFLFSGGFDYRFTDTIVVNAGLNVGLVEDTTDVGLLLTLGYIFP